MRIAPTILRKAHWLGVAALALVLLVAASGLANAQMRQVAVLQVGSIQSDAEFVRIQYTVPYEGYVEVRLFGPDDRLVGRKHYVVNVGEHEALIHRSRLQPGQQYTFTIIYKGREYPGSFFAD
jgi:hypothetical protein